MRHLGLAVIVLAAAALGCGSSAPAPDTEPPAVVHTSPSAGAEDVRVTEPIVVRFSEPIQDGFRVHLFAGEQEIPLAPGALEVAEGGREVRIAAPSGLAPPQRMRLEVTDVVDRWDNPLHGGVDLEWTYPAWIRLGSRPYASDPLCGGGLTPILVTAGHPPYVGADYAQRSYRKFCAARWTGAEWQVLPDPTGGAEVLAGYAADPSGGLVACACTASGPCTVWRHDGAAWQDLGTVPVSDANDCQPGYRGDVLHVVVRSPLQWYRAFRRDGTGWSARGSPFAVPIANTPPSISELADADFGLVLLLGSDRNSGVLYSLPNEDWMQVENSPGASVANVGVSDLGVLALAGEVVRLYSRGAWTTVGDATGLGYLFARKGVAPVAIQRRTESVAGAPAWYVRVLELDHPVWRPLGPEMESGPVPSAVAADASGRVFLTNPNDVVYQYNR